MDSTSTKKREGFLGQKMIFIPENIRQRILRNPLVRSLYMTSIGYYPNAENHYRERKEGADQFILIYCIEGEGNVEIDTKNSRLAPNHFFIIPPNTSHRYKADEDSPWSIYWLHFTGSNAGLLYERYQDNTEFGSVGQVSFQKSRINFFERIIAILEKGYSKRNVEYVNLKLWELLSSFIYPEFFQEMELQVNEPDYVNDAIELMQESLDQRLTVDEIADHVSYSKSYFHSLFKEKTGFPPKHYFNQLKIQKACQYLSFTDLSVKEISYELGFDDPFYFSRVFKKMMDISPSEYQKLYKKDTGLYSD